MPTFSADRLLHHIAVLSSDAFEGRGPGTPAEARVLAYLEAEFAALGLEPGMPDGTWTQPVGLVGYTSRPAAHFTTGGHDMSLTLREDFVAASRHRDALVTVAESPLIFVGYGVTAPEYDWDDYRGLDVKGKTVVVLVGDPPVETPGAPGQLDPAMFHGKALTYHGRWTCKLEQASRHGAAAAIIVHQTATAGYPWQVVGDSWGGENMDVIGAPGADERVRVEAWITHQRARELFRAAGQDFDALERAAARQGFTAVPLAATVTFRVENSTREFSSHNFLARIPGADPARRHEHVIYMAHWDHLGMDPNLSGDPVYHGAIDNASGVAALLELARAIRHDGPPSRSILFLATTAEEKGLLGSRFYAGHPVYPLEQTLAVFNIDGLNAWGRTRDLVVIGKGNSTLEDLLEEAATRQGRVLSPDPEPEKGFFFRADHFEIAKLGVPALYLEPGVDFIGRPPEYGRQRREAFTSQDYHKPTDVIKPDWDLTGAIEDLELLLRVGRRIATEAAWPEWKPGSEFRALRDAMLAARPPR
jgi:Zn-dependent M28 family amino/carboxypeptidase